jgi:hypothetical protein
MEAELWAIPLGGGDARPLGLPVPGVFVNPAQVSPDGRRVAYTKGPWKFDLWRLQHALPLPGLAR